MNSFTLTTPVAFIIFKRPDTTFRVFEEIRKAKPSKLFIIADGARVNQIGEAEQCIRTRAIVEKVDWDCEVLTNYSDINLGCKLRLVTGLNWVFSQVEEAIILEDDCLPDATFFRFCQELLEHYRYDTRITSISGNNFLPSNQRTQSSYYFSRFPHIWGWATWRRTWQQYDVNMSLWPQIAQGKWLLDILGDSKDAEYWYRLFDITYKQKIDTWDYQWVFACWMQSGLGILPNVNLVSNIGSGADATHTQNESPLMNIPTKDMKFPILHPPYVIRDAWADTYTQENIYG